MTRRRPVGRLAELAVTDLGIIEHASLLFGNGMTALTGETGAGKTLLVGAIDLLLGGRADPAMVRRGASEAVIEGRFELEDEELVLRRVVPATGRSRAYVNGRMATAGELGKRSAALVDLHGQHEHQSLLSGSSQRDALDRYAGVDLGPLQEAVERCRELRGRLDAMGGDQGARDREIDLLRFQLDELEAADLTDPGEDDALDQEEDALANAVAHREAAHIAHLALSGDGGGSDQVAAAVAALDDRPPYADSVKRLRDLLAELEDISATVRDAGEEIADDPARLAVIRERRQLLVDLRRKYGTAGQTGDGGSGAGTLADVIAYENQVRGRLADLERHDEVAVRLESELRSAETEMEIAAAAVGASRRSAAPGLAAAVEARLHDLAMAKARIEITVGDEEPGDEVTFLLAANTGSSPAPLRKVASGGELARTMLALRLVLSDAPPVLLFDEVDAGIGGEAALAVGRALAQLGADHQVLVVTHLPQVAAFADAQVHVHKALAGARDVATATTLDPESRVVELSRMLSGTPDSERVRVAAEELLQRAAAERLR